MTSTGADDSQAKFADGDWDSGAAHQVQGASHSASWRWYICVLLLLATVVNYMDRLTVNLSATQIQADFRLNNEDYGNLELGFGVAFAVGSLFFGWLVDRIGVYWLYPIVLVGWSAMGYLTGLSRTYNELLGLRVLLGLFEAGHFPCGLKTIQQLLAPRDRALGNSLLQSGTALGAVLAPQAIKLLATGDVSGWRRPFLVIGAGGTVWVLLWLLSIRPRDLRVKPFSTKAEVAKPETDLGEDRSYWQHIFSARFLCLAVMVVCINMNWHFFRVWLPKLLQDARGYNQNQMLDFSTLYYVAADVGAIAAGVISGRLARRGMSVFASRMWVYAGCCVLTAFTTAAPFLPAGPLLQATLLIVACGGLGSYAAYYSLTQDLSRKHQGKISGALSTTTWMVNAVCHRYFGRYLDRTNSYELALGAVGWLPMIALVVTLLLWNRGRARSSGLTEDGLVSSP
jgi:MFS transporter, ACS family, hexuronate transporter